MSRMLFGMSLLEAIQQGRAEPPSGISTLGLDRTHEWLTALEHGRAEFSWTVDDTHMNLDGAVICSWTTALADQAMFFASNTVCEHGESTRMRSLGLDVLEDITGGVVTIRAVVKGRSDDQLYCTADFFTEDGVLAAVVTATVEIIRHE